MLVAIFCHGGIAIAQASRVDLSEQPYNGSVHLDDASGPDPARTPGDVLAKASRKDLCDADKDSRQHAPSYALCEGAFDDYRIPPERRFQYSCDFLVPLSIGGASTPLNVWPQPVQEAAFKQALDKELRNRICSAEVSPRDAQRQVASDWVRTYRRYLLPGDAAPIVVDSHPPADARLKVPPFDGPASIQASSGDLSPQIMPSDMQRRRQHTAAQGDANGQNIPHTGITGIAGAPSGVGPSSVTSGLQSRSGVPVPRRATNASIQRPASNHVHAIKR